jgi:hypothetical protein
MPRLVLQGARIDLFLIQQRLLLSELVMKRNFVRCNVNVNLVYSE